MGWIYVLAIHCWVDKAHYGSGMTQKSSTLEEPSNPNVDLCSIEYGHCCNLLSVYFEAEDPSVKA